MREMKYLSHSGMKLYYEDAEAFYARYCAEVRPPREPQNHYMAVGSSFDAYVKSYLFNRLVGRDDKSQAFDTLFTNQVEPHNRDRALVDGKEVFDFYKKCGALADLILDMEGCVGEPKFEVEITGHVGVSNRIGAVPILGKPDIFFITKHGARIIFDWKVNGFYSKSPASPKTGYLKLFPGSMPHPKTQPLTHRGFTVSGNYPLNFTDKEWASQLSTYAWVLGEEVGGDFICIIDQICCNSTTRQHRVARHVGTVQEKFQQEVFDKYHTCWYAVKNNHVFRNLSYEDSLMRCKTLDTIFGTPLPQDNVFDSLTETKKRYR
jgi:hypothetical protein